MNRINKLYQPSKSGYLMFLLFLFITSANAQVNTNLSQDSLSETNKISAEVPRGFINHGLKDKAGNLWFSAIGQGVFYYNGKSFTNFTEAHGLGTNNVSAIYEDSSNNIWFGTPDGVSRYDGKTFNNIKIPVNKDSVFSPLNPSQSSISVGSILQDTKGNFWFGTGQKGVFLYDGKTFTNFLQNDGALYNGRYSNVIQSILEDRSGNLWFASFSHGGVYRYDGKSFTNFSLTEGLSDNMIYCMLEDKNGNIWIGTRENGVCRYDGNSFTHFSVNDGLCNNCVTSIFEDRTGTIWFGSDRGGFCSYDGNSFTDFSDNEGLINNRIWTIIEDITGNLWIGTRGGLFLYDGKTFNGFSE